MKSLLIIRTPLQAWIASAVLIEERVGRFDVVYITSHDGEEDRKAVSRLRTSACKSWYVVCPPRSPDLLHQLEIGLRLASIRSISRGRNWRSVFLASYDSHPINSFANRAGADEIITFDDGTANINEQSTYAPNAMSSRDRIYRRLFGGLSNRTFINGVARHYTIFGDADHLMERSKLRYLEPFFHGQQGRQGAREITYFVGVPYDQVFNLDQIARLNAAVRRFHIDYLIRHPRQTAELAFEVGIDVLDKRGEIAERAIEVHSNGQPIRLIGWFSTVMFTMRPVAAHRIVLLASDDGRTPGMARIAKNAGCEVVEF